MTKEQNQEVPLKTILQNFLNHVKNFEIAREEANNGEGEDKYEEEFQSLKAFSEELKHKDEFSCSEGDSAANSKKNRYKDILPFNYSRVVLSEYPGIPGSDYINANYIKGASGSNAYIASQGPLPHTVNDWWRMVVELEVQVIVMACQEQEGGKHKCECYWSEGEQPKQYGAYSVSLLKSREICPDFLVRTMKLTWSGEGGEEQSRTVCQFHYSAWPDHGVPNEVKPLLEMVRLVRDCQASETLPVLVHCSAGCGRTGSICVIDYVWGLLKTGKLTPDFSLYNLVKDMRRQRIAMVQTVDQYMLCHRAVRELFQEQLRVIDSHPYENVGNDGRPLVDRDKSVTPEYETIDYSKVNSGVVDIDSVISARQTLPKMGIGMLSREKSPSMIHLNGDTSEASSSSDNSLPTTIDDLRSVRSTPSGTPKIHEPPIAPANNKETAAQRFKKGNLRLLQSEDGGWKLEELEERRRSLETGVAKAAASDNNNESKFEGNEPTKPPQGDNRKDRRKKSKDSDKSESNLFRRPSMKKIKEFFDKDKNKENRDNESLGDSDSVSITGSVAHRLAFSKEDFKGDPKAFSKEYESAVAKMPSLETSGGFFSTSIPDERAGMSKSVPSSLDRKQKYKQDPDPEQASEKTSNNSISKLWPLKKENKNSKSNEKLQGGDKPALPVKRSKSMKSPTKPVSVIPVLSSSSGEPSFSVEPYRDEDASNYDTYPKSARRSDEFIDLTKKSPEGSTSRPISSSTSRENLLRSSSSKENLRTAGVPPPKPKRDWSSLNHDYANVKMPGAVESRFEFPSSNGGCHSRQGSGDMSSHRSSEQFLDQQMAKLMARKGQDEVDGSSMVMKRSKSGDCLSSRKRTSEILDDDTRKILRDCQEYLLRDQDQGVTRVTTSSHSSPNNSYNKYSASPNSSYNKYSARTSSGNLSLSPNNKPVTKSPDKSSYNSPVRNADYNADQNNEHSPMSDGDHEYENVAKSCYIDARGKISAATNVRSRERRNSFRQAVVDKAEPPGQPTKPYEQIWFRGEDADHSPRGEMDQRTKSSSSLDPRNSASSLDPRHSASSLDPRKSQLRKSDSGSLRSQSGTNVKSGSYDNIPGPSLNTTQAIFTLDPNPTAYEIINFSQPRVSSAGLTSAGLVAEACRDQQPKQILTKQHSGQSRAPPPYQNPPGPTSASYHNNSTKPTHVSPPKHISPNYSANNRYPDHLQVDTSPRRPVSSKGPPPPYPSNITDGVRKIDINTSRTRPIPPQHQTTDPVVTMRQARLTRDDTHLSSMNMTKQTKNMKRNSSLVTTARLSMGDFILSTTGLQVKQADKAVKTVTVGGGTPGSVVQGPRTAVIMGGGEVDLDRVAASMTHDRHDTASVTSSQGPGAKQLGRSIAGAITGAAANFKSKLVNMGSGGTVARSSPSPPDSGHTTHAPTGHRSMVSTAKVVREVPIRLEQSAGGSSVSPHVIPLTVPGAEYGYSQRGDKRPLAPQQFQKKQEYL